MPHLPRPTTTSTRSARHRLRAVELRTRRIRREVAYLLVTAVLGLVGLACVVVLIVTGPVLALSVIGLPLVGVAIVAARAAGGLQREVVARTVHRDVPPPARAERGTGLIGWTRSALTDRAGWRTVAYLVVHLPVVVATVVIGAVGLGAAALVLDPLWRLVAPPGWLGGSWAQTVGLAVGGVLVLAVLPWVVRLVVRVDLRLVRSFLGATERDVRIEQARTMAVTRAAAALREIEEQDPAAEPAAATVGPVLDLRDGERPDPVAAPPDRAEPEEVGDAAEPILDLAAIERMQRDRGLGQVLALLAAEVPTPTRLHLDLNRTPVPRLLEALAEEAATELMSNVVRHSGAELVELSLIAGNGALTLRVSDDGHGGVEIGEGTGLDRLTALIAPVGGQLVLSSPHGGPTDITVALPLTGGTPEPAPRAGAASVGDGSPRTDGRPPRVVHRRDVLATRRLRGAGRQMPRRPVP